MVLAVSAIDAGRRAPQPGLAAHHRPARHHLHRRPGLRVHVLRDGRAWASRPTSSARPSSRSPASTASTSASASSCCCRCSCCPAGQPRPRAGRDGRDRRPVLALRRRRVDPDLHRRLPDRLGRPMSTATADRGRPRRRARPRPPDRRATTSRSPSSSRHHRRSRSAPTSGGPLRTMPSTTVADPALFLMMVVKFAIVASLLHAPEVRQQDPHAGSSTRACSWPSACTDRAVHLPHLELPERRRAVQFLRRGPCSPPSAPTSGRGTPHPEVWVLVGALVGLYVYAAQVIGPKVGARPAPRRSPGASRLRSSPASLLLWFGRRTGRCTTSASSTCSSCT